MRRLILLAAALLPASLLPAGAGAHVVLDPPTAAANAYVRVAFRVGHGCGGAATLRLAVTLPEGVTTARPQPKPGWTIAPRPTPTAPLLWEGGPLEDQHYDEFVVLIRTPDRPGTSLRFPALQGCAAGREALWDGPTAPTLRLLPRP